MLLSRVLMRHVIVRYSEINMRLKSNGLQELLIWLMITLHKYTSFASNSTHQNATSALTTWIPSMPNGPSTLNGSTTMLRSQPNTTSLPTLKSPPSTLGMTAAPTGTSSHADNTSHAGYISNSTSNISTTIRPTTYNVATVTFTPTCTHGTVRVSMRKTSGSASSNAPKPFGYVYAIPIVVTMILLLM